MQLPNNHPVFQFRFIKSGSLKSKKIRKVVSTKMMKINLILLLMNLRKFQEWRLLFKISHQINRIVQKNSVNIDPSLPLISKI